MKVKFLVDRYYDGKHHEKGDVVDISDKRLAESYINGKEAQMYKPEPKAESVREAVEAGPENARKAVNKTQKSD